MAADRNALVWMVGRVLLSLIFLLSGVMKIVNWSQTADHMASEGMVAVPFFLLGAIILELGGGLSLLLGCKARFGALALLLFLIPATLIFHDFWTFEGPAVQNQLQHFLKNLTIMGGLLIVVAGGAGRYALDTYLASQLRVQGDSTHAEPVAALSR